MKPYLNTRLSFAIAGLLLPGLALATSLGALELLPSGSEELTDKERKELQVTVKKVGKARVTSVKSALRAIEPVIEKSMQLHPEMTRQALEYWAKKVAQVDPKARERHERVAVIAAMRNLVSAQAQMQATAMVDVDDDGVGEYGYFAELAGAVPVRGRNERLDPPVLSSRFRKVSGGRVTFSGYHFAIFLPDHEGSAHPEQDGGGSPPALRDERSSDNAEVAWCLYAWPAQKSNVPQALFVVNQWGDILTCKNDKANGGAGCVGDVEPDPGAAFLPEQEGILGDLAVNALGQNGERWTVCN